MQRNNCYLTLRDFAKKLVSATGLCSFALSFEQSQSILQQRELIDMTTGDEQQATHPASPAPNFQQGLTTVEVSPDVSPPRLR